MTPQCRPHCCKPGSWPNPSAPCRRSKACPSACAQARCTRCWARTGPANPPCSVCTVPARRRSEEHTSELQSHLNLVCRLLLEKKKQGIYFKGLKIDWNALIQAVSRAMAVNVNATQANGQTANVTIGAPRYNGEPMLERESSSA